MFEVLLLSLHVLLIVTWVGVDSGVFYASFRIRRRGLSLDAVTELRRVMRVLDLPPRLSMAAMVGIAPTLAWQSGYVQTGPFGATFVSVAAVVSVFWVALSVYRFVREPALAGTRLALVGADRRFEVLRAADLYLRGVVATLLLLVGASSMYTDSVLLASPKLGFKTLVLGVVVGASLGIRARGGPFASGLAGAVASLEAGQTVAQSDHEDMDRGMRAVYPFVLAVWTGVLLNALVAIAY